MSIWGILRRWALGGGRARVAAAARGRVLELGIGGGANLRFYRPPLELVGLDPWPEALAEARLAAGHPGGVEDGPSGRPAPSRLSVSLVCARAEALPFCDRSLDGVVGTLVFCSVGDPAAALAEVRRVLKPGAELRLAEHVLPARGPLRPLVRLLGPLWFRWSGECRIDRDTPRAVRAAGLRIRELRSQLLGALVEITAGEGGNGE